MQTVGTIRAIGGRNHLCGVNGLWQFVYLLVHGDALTFTVSLYHFTSQQRHFLWFQFKVAKHTIIYFLNFVCPFGVARVRFSLMHQYSLDDTIVLGFLRQFDDTLVRIVVVSFQHVLHPSWSRLHIFWNFLWHESFNLDTANGNVNDSHANVFWQRRNQRTTKPVGRCQSVIGATEWRNCFTPFSLFPVSLWVIYGRHQQETWTRTYQVLCFWTGCTFHVGLSETDENVKVRVYLS